MDTYARKLLREQAYYTDEGFDTEHFLNCRLFFSQKRQAFNYGVAKQAMAATVERLMRASGVSDPSLLIAPIGVGNDLPYVGHLAKQIVGIDISQEALDQISHPHVRTIRGDMRHMESFPDGYFDLVLTPLFFHHYRDAFEPFLGELVRVLRPGGHFVTLEPSILYPLSWVTRSLRRLAGNITGQVEDEAPLIPAHLARAMSRCGLQNVRVDAASFAHNRLPIAAARIINLLTRPFSTLPLVRHCGWLCLFSGQKPLTTDTTVVQLRLRLDGPERALDAAAGRTPLRTNTLAPPHRDFRPQAPEPDHGASKSEEPITTTARHGSKGEPGGTETE